MFKGHLLSRTWESKTLNPIAVNSACLGIIAIIFFLNCFPFERVAGGIFQITKTVPSVISNKAQNGRQQTFNKQHACCSHNNVI